MHKHDSPTPHDEAEHAFVLKRSTFSSGRRVADEKPDRRNKNANEMFVAIVLLSFRGGCLSKQCVDVYNLNLELVPAFAVLQAGKGNRWSVGGSCFACNCGTGDTPRWTPALGQPEQFDARMRADLLCAC